MKRRRNKRIPQPKPPVLRLGRGRRTVPAKAADLPAGNLPAGRSLVRWGLLLALAVGGIYLYASSLNLLIVGTDDVDYAKHTDTLMVVHWRPLPRRLALLSIPRDTLVRLPKRGPMKINAVYAYGNVVSGKAYALAMTRATVENLLGLKMHYTVHIRYSNFITLVDALGGVPLYVAKRMQYIDNAGGVNIDLEPGYQLLDGRQSLNYVRFRHDRSGDLGRIRRQQQFMKAFMAQSLRFSRLPRTLGAFVSFVKQVETDLSPLAAVFLALDIRGLSEQTWRQAIVPGRAEYIEGRSYWKPDYASLQHVVADLGRPPRSKTQKAPATTAASAVLPAATPATKVAPPEPGPTPEPTLAPLPSGPQPVVRVLNGCGVSGVASRVTAVLRGDRIAVEDTHVTNAPSFDYALTIVKSTGKNLPWARRIATILRLDSSRIQEIPAGVAYPTVTVVIGGDHRELPEPR